MDTSYFNYKIVFYYLILVLGVGLCLSIIDFVQKKYRFTFKNIGILWTVYTVEWGIHILVYLFAIPIFLILFLLQPVLGLAFLIAIILIIIYVAGLFFDQPIVGNPPSSKDAILGLLTIVVCIIVWVLATRLFKSEDNLYDRYADFYNKKIVMPVKKRLESFLEKMDM